MQKMSFEAEDKKKGLSLADLETFVAKLVGMANDNGTDKNESKVTVMVNFSGNIKQLTAEV